jgi:hypothetical protein
MITGLNTSVPFEDEDYHVQSEDRGVADPILESTIYLHGAVLGKKKTSYKKFLESDSFSPAALRTMLEAQHYSIVRAIRSGRLTARYNKRPGQAAEEKAPVARPHVEILSNVLNEAAQEPAQEMRIRIIETFHAEPVADTEVSVEVFGSGITPQRLKGRTDHDGYLNLHIDIPKSHRVAAAMLFRVDRPEPGQELKVLVVRDHKK